MNKHDVTKRHSGLSYSLTARRSQDQLPAFLCRFQVLPGYLDFLPQTQNKHIKLIGNSTLLP